MSRKDRALARAHRLQRPYPSDSTSTENAAHCFARCSERSPAPKGPSHPPRLRLRLSTAFASSCPSSVSCDRLGRAYARPEPAVNVRCHPKAVAAGPLDVAVAAVFTRTRRAAGTARRRAPRLRDVDRSNPCPDGLCSGTGTCRLTRTFARTSLLERSNLSSRHRRPLSMCA